MFTTPPSLKGKTIPFSCTKMCAMNQRLHCIENQWLNETARLAELTRLLSAGRGRSGTGGKRSRSSRAPSRRRARRGSWRPLPTPSPRAGAGSPSSAATRSRRFQKTTSMKNSDGAVRFFHCNNHFLVHRKTERRAASTQIHLLCTIA